MNISDYGDKFINVMKHAIGLNYVSPRYGKYKPFRNHYCAPECGDAVWERLELDGYARRSSATMYHLTPKALDEMEHLIGAKITDWENVERHGRLCGNCYYHGGEYKGKQFCLNAKSHYRNCRTKPTNKCKYHNYKKGLVYGGLAPGKHGSRQGEADCEAADDERNKEEPE
jgi:hypothetical protein